MSFLASSTIKSASAPRIPSTRSKENKAPIPAQQKKEKAADREKTQEEIQIAVQEWYDDTTRKAEELANKFSKKPRYFLDMFFFGGAHMVTHHDKVNPHNAFVSMKSQELRDEGRTLSMMQIQAEFKDEYSNLNDEEREQLAKEHKVNMDTSKRIRRSPPRGRIQDFSNTCRNITLLINGLKTRIGVEGFFCVVRSTPDYYHRPHWYFTTPALSDYMNVAAGKGWDSHRIGMKAEAFAIAGCDIVNMLDTSKKKAAFLKSEIRNLIATKLVDITGNPKALMQYNRYQEDIVQRYGIILKGWTYDTLVNPSDLSSSLQPLTVLRDALKSDICKFVKLSAAELKEQCKTYQAKIAANEIQPLKRKHRSDKGVPCKRAKMTPAQINDGVNDNGSSIIE